MEKCGVILAASLLCLNVLLCAVCAQNENDDRNDVSFDFNRYYRVVINSTKPTPKPEVINGKLVTLYNPNVWPGPDDTNSLTTTIPIMAVADAQVMTVTPPTRFRFGLRRTLIGENKNMGYGYDYNQTLPVTTTTTQPITADFGRRTLSQTRMYSSPAINSYNASFDNTRFYRRRLSNNSVGNYHPQSYTPYRRTSSSVVYSNNPNPVQSSSFTVRSTPSVVYSRNNQNPVKTIVYNNNQNPVQSSSSFNLRTLRTNGFSCVGQPYYGYYADMLSNCQRFHICTPDGRQTTFICPINTQFNQVLIICDWYYNVNCQLSPNFYQINAIKFREWNALKLG